MSINDPYGKLCNSHLLKVLRFVHWTDLSWMLMRKQRWPCPSISIQAGMQQGSLAPIGERWRGRRWCWCFERQNLEVASFVIIINAGDACLWQNGWMEFLVKVRLLNHPLHFFQWLLSSWWWYHHHHLQHLFLWRCSLFWRRQFHGRMISLKQKITLEIAHTYIFCSVHQCF